MEESKGTVQVGVQTDLISGMITSHAKKIDAIDHNERLRVIDVDVEGRVSKITAEILEEKAN